MVTGPTKKPVLIFPTGLLRVLKGCYKVSPQPSVLWAEQPQFSQIFLIGEVLQPLECFCSPPLAPLQQLHVCPVLGAPEPDTGLQMGSDQSRVAESPPSTCWPPCFWCSPGYNWLSGLQEDIDEYCYGIQRPSATAVSVVTLKHFQNHRLSQVLLSLWRMQTGITQWHLLHKLHWFWLEQLLMAGVQELIRWFWEGAHNLPLGQRLPRNDTIRSYPWTYPKPTAYLI